MSLILLIKSHIWMSDQKQNTLQYKKSISLKIHTFVKYVLQSHPVAVQPPYYKYSFFR